MAMVIDPMAPDSRPREETPDERIQRERLDPTQRAIQEAQTPESEKPADQRDQGFDPRIAPPPPEGQGSIIDRMA